VWTAVVPGTMVRQAYRAHGVTEPSPTGGVRVPRGGLVVLDVHGTDHDPEHWPDPDRFDPDRFLNGSVDPTPWFRRVAATCPAVIAAPRRGSP
jgi:cytochrome P450